MACTAIPQGCSNPSQGRERCGRALHQGGQPCSFGAGSVARRARRARRERDSKHTKLCASAHFVCFNQPRQADKVGCRAAHCTASWQQGSQGNCKLAMLKQASLSTCRGPRPVRRAGSSPSARGSGCMGRTIAYALVTEARTCQRQVLGCSPLLSSCLCRMYRCG